MWGGRRSLTPALGPASRRPPSSWTNITPPAGRPNPLAREFPSMTYDPATHNVLMFGGISATTYDNATWTFSNGNWTEVISNASCTSTTCPSIRAGAMMTYYAPLNAVLLFGGFFSIFTFIVAFNDSWLYYNGAWHNITDTAGLAPSPRYLAAMTWDSLDNDVVLFGGASVSGTTLDDTWTFNGTWHNVTARVKTLSNNIYPSSRAGMAISSSPSGYLLMFGGESSTAGGNVLEDAPALASPYPSSVGGSTWTSGPRCSMAERVSTLRAGSCQRPQRRYNRPDMRPPAAESTRRSAGAQRISISSSTAGTVRRRRRIPALGQTSG